MKVYKREMIFVTVLIKITPQNLSMYHKKSITSIKNLAK